jgi:hypothetical protein
VVPNMNDALRPKRLAIMLPVMQVNVMRANKSALPALK